VRGGGRARSEIEYLVRSLAVIPLVTHGITFSSRFQLWTQPVWIVLHVLPLASSRGRAPNSFPRLDRFTGRFGDFPGGFDLSCLARGSVVLL